MPTDKEYMERLGLRDGDIVRNEYLDGIDGGPPRFVGTKIIRASGEIVAWPLTYEQKTPDAN